MGEKDDEIASEVQEKSQICAENKADDETTAPHELEQRNEEEETGNKAEKKTMIGECTKGGEEGLVRENEEKKTIIGAADAFDEEKKALVDEGNKGEEDGLVRENAEKKSKVNDDTNEDGANKSSNDDEWTKRKVAVEELTLNLEARMDKAEKTLAMIRKWKMRKIQIQN